MALFSVYNIPGQQSLSVFFPTLDPEAHVSHRWAELESGPTF